MIDPAGDDRSGRRSTIISQLPTGTWHDYLDEPTVADDILDRVVRNAHKINLEGGSMRTRDVAGGT